MLCENKRYDAFMSVGEWTYETYETRLKNHRKEKLNRQEIFRERFGKEVIRYTNKDWIVLCKIKIDDLYDESMEEEIFYNLIHNMLYLMLLVEDISKKIPISAV